MHRPSSLPALAASPCFVPNPQGSEYTNAGTDRHKALEALLSGKPTADLLLRQLPDDDREGVEWAADYVRANMSTGFVPDFERKLSLLDDAFETVIAGTPDIVCGPDLFDLKWRERNYREQMAAYALMILDANPEFKVIAAHLLFGASKRAVKILFTREECERLVYGIINSVTLNAPETPSDYCDWCAKFLTCPAVIARANAVVDGREDWKLENYHPSQITNPDELAKGLELAHLLADWSESFIYHAKEQAKQGNVATGWQLTEKRGHRTIPDVAAAYGAAGLPQDKFLAACEVKFTKLVEQTMALNGVKKAAAERDMEAKLGDTLQRKSSSISITKIKTKNA